MNHSRPYQISDFVRAYKINGLNLSTYMGIGQVVAETMTDVELLVKSWGGDNQVGNHLLKKHEYYFEIDDFNELPPEAPANRYSIEMDELRYQIRIMETTPNGVQEAACYEQGDWRQSPNIVFQLVRDIISVLTKDEMSSFASWKENDTDLKKRENLIGFGPRPT